MYQEAVLYVSELFVSCSADKLIYGVSSVLYLFCQFYYAIQELYFVAAQKAMHLIQYDLLSGLFVSTTLMILLIDRW